MPAHAATDGRRSERHAVCAVRVRVQRRRFVGLQRANFYFALAEAKHKLVVAIAGPHERGDCRVLQKFVANRFLLSPLQTCSGFRV